MKKLLKWLLVVVVVLLATSILAVTLFLNPAVRKLKPTIVSKLSAALGAEVQIGEISAQVMPSTQIELADVVIGGENGLRVKHVFVDTKISDVIKGEISLKNILIESPTAKIVKSRDGAIRIGGLKFGGSGPKGGSPSSAPGEAAEGQRKERSPVGIHNLEIRNGNFNFIAEAQPAPVSFDLTDFDLTVSDYKPDAETPVSFRMTAFSKSQRNISGNGKVIPASLQSDRPVGQLALEISTLNLGAVSKILGSFVKDGELALDGDLTSKLTATSAAEGVVTRLELDATRSDISYSSRNSSRKIRKAANSPFRLVSNANILPSKEVDVKSFDLKMQDSIISGASRFSFGKQFQPGVLNLSLQPLKLENLAALIALPLKLSGSATGTLSVDSTRKPLPDLTGSIALSDVSGANENEIFSGMNGELAFDKNVVSTSGLQLSLKGEQLALKGVLAELKDDQISTPDLKISGLGGIISVQNTLATEGPKPISGRLTMNSIDMKRLIAMAAGPTPYTVTGTLADFSSAYRGTVDNLKRDLAADFQFTVSNGEVLGINILGAVFKKIAIPGLAESLADFIPEKYRPLVTAANSTAFESLVAAGNIQNGSEVFLSRADLTHEVYKILGSGRASTQGTLDLKTQMKLTPEMTESMVSRNNKLRFLLDGEGNLTFPLVIVKNDGPLVVLPDVSQLGKNALKGVAKDEAEKALEKVAPGLKGAGKLLDKLF